MPGNPSPNGGVIPSRYQIPMAVALGAVFILLCIRVYVRISADDQPSAPPDDPSAAFTAPLDAPVVTADLWSMLDKMDSLMHASSGTKELPQISHDPFDMSLRVLARRFDESAASAPLATGMSGREDRLAQIELKGTLASGADSWALVGDAIFRIGESIAGFEVVSIAPDHIVVHDELGPTTVRLRGDQSR